MHITCLWKPIVFGSFNGVAILLKRVGSLRRVADVSVLLEKLMSWGRRKAMLLERRLAWERVPRPVSNHGCWSSSTIDGGRDFGAECGLMMVGGSRRNSLDLATGVAQKVAERAARHKALLNAAGRGADVCVPSEHRNFSHQVSRGWERLDWQ